MKGFSQINFTQGVIYIVGYIGWQDYPCPILQEEKLDHLNALILIQSIIHQTN